MNKYFISVSYINNSYRKFGKVLTRNAFYHLVTCKLLRDIIRKLRKNNLTEEQRKKLKQKLPAVLFMAQSTEDGSRVTKDIALPSGLAFVDYDHFVQSREELIDIYNKVVAPKADEMKLVLAMISPSGDGLHLIVELPAGCTPRQCQVLVDEITGLKHDEATKDLSRLCYLSEKEDILFINEEKLFNLEVDDEYVQSVLSAIAKEEGMAAKTSSDDPMQFEFSDQLALPASMIKVEVADEDKDYARNFLYKGVVPFGRIIEEIFNQIADDGNPKVGDRNNMLFKVACMISPLVKRNFNVVYKLLEPYFRERGLSDKEIRTTVASATSRAGAYTSSPTPIVNNIIRMLYLEYGGLEEIPIPEIPELPLFFEKILSYFPKSLHHGVIMATLASLSVFASNVRFNYMQTRLHPLTFLVFVMAPFASNKSFITHVWKMLGYRLIARDKQNEKKIEAERQARVNSSANERKITNVYHKQTMASKITSAGVYKHIQENPGKISMLTTEEIKSLCETGKKTYGDIPEILCHAFDGSEVSKTTAGDASANVREDCYISTLIAGTDAEVYRFFGTGEDGLASRASIVKLLSNLDEDIAHFYNPTPEERVEIDAVIDALAAEVGTNEDGTVVYSFPLFEALNDRMLKDSRDEFRKTQDEMWRKLAFRSHVMGYRAGVIGWLVSGKPDEVNLTDPEAVQSDEMRRVINLMQWVTQYVQTMQYYVMGPRIQKALAANTIDCPQYGRNTNLLDELPKYFSTKDLELLRAQKNVATTSNPYMITSRWKKYGYIQKCKENPKLWEKIV